MLDTPAPNVLLDSVDGVNLLFNATGSVASPRLAASVRSALLFDILARLKAQGLSVGRPPTLVLREQPAPDDPAVGAEPRIQPGSTGRADEDNMPFDSEPERVRADMARLGANAQEATMHPTPTVTRTLIAAPALAADSLEISEQRCTFLGNSGQD